MIFKSPSPNVAIPDICWPEYFMQCIAPYHDKPALINGLTGQTLSFTELENAIYAVAQALQKKAYGKGDVIAIYAANSPEYVIVFQAVLLLGGVVTTTNPLYTSHELAHQLVHSRAVCLFTTSLLLTKAKSAIKGSQIRDICLLDEADNELTLAQLFQSGRKDQFKQVNFSPAQDLAVLPYSSGTTGLPKGVMLSHTNLVAHNTLIIKHKNATSPNETDSIAAILPFFHIFGMTIVMNLSLSLGAALIILPGFEPAQFLQSIQDYKITRTYLVPPILLFLAEHPLVDEYDISSLLGIISGAAPLSEDMALAVQKRIDCPIFQGYGMTEMSPATHWSPDQSSIINPGSVGVLLPNTEAMILHTDTGEAVAENMQGELLVRGPQMMLGYLANPQATSETIDEKGWLHTGDIAYADADGYFFLVDRLKELIKYKGYQVAPAELEALLLTHPAVSDVAVIAKTDTAAGEIPVAFIVQSKEITATELMEWVAARVAPYKKIREVTFIDKIPKSPSGKILRRVLRKK